MIEFTKEEIVSMITSLREVILDLRHYYNTDSIAAYKLEEVQSKLGEKLEEEVVHAEGTND